MINSEFIPVGPDPISEEDRLEVQRLYDEAAEQAQRIIDSYLEPKRKAARKLVKAGILTEKEVELLFGVEL